MIKNIDQEIEKLVKIKKEVDSVNELKKSKNNIFILSQARYDFFASKNLLKPDILYYIVDVETGRYIEGFQG